MASLVIAYGINAFAQASRGGDVIALMEANKASLAVTDKPLSAKHTILAATCLNESRCLESFGRVLELLLELQLLIAPLKPPLVPRNRGTSMRRRSEEGGGK